MPKPRMTVALAAIAITAMASLNAAAPGRAEEKASEAAPPSSQNLFEGKILGIVAKGEDSTTWLCKVRVVQIDNRPFMIGETYNPDVEEFKEYASHAGIMSGIALDQVIRFKAFTEEQFTNHVTKWQKRSSSEPKSDPNPYIEKF